MEWFVRNLILSVAASAVKQLVVVWLDAASQSWRVAGPSANCDDGDPKSGDVLSPLGSAACQASRLWVG